MKRGQTLSYDGIGAAVIFMVAIGLLATNWVITSAPENMDLIKMSQKSLERIIDDQLLINGYQLDENKIKNCDIKFSSAGIVTSYNLSIIDGDKVIYTCANIGNDVDQNDKGIAERIYYMEDKPVKIRLEIYSK